MSETPTPAVKHPRWVIWTGRLILAALLAGTIIIGGAFAHVAHDLAIFGWNLI